MKRDVKSMHLRTWHPGSCRVGLVVHLHIQRLMGFSDSCRATSQCSHRSRERPRLTMYLAVAENFLYSLMTCRQSQQRCQLHVKR